MSVGGGAGAVRGCKVLSNMRSGALGLIPSTTNKQAAGRQGAHLQSQNQGQKGRGSEVQGPPRLHRKFEASLGYMKPCL